MRFQDLLAYKKSFELSMAIFETTKSFPKEEKFSLTKLEDLQEAFQIILPKLQGKKGMSTILFRN